VVFYFEDTARVAQQVLDAHPDHLEARLLLASARFQLGDVDAAAKEAEAAVTRHPAAYGGHALVGRIAFHRFVSLRQRLDREQPAGEERTQQLAAIDAARTTAQQALEAAAAADPQRSFPRVKLGDIAAWTGQTKVALEHYLEALVLEPRAAVDHGWVRQNVSLDERTALYDAAQERLRARGGASKADQAVLAWYAAQTKWDARDWETAKKLFAATLEPLPDYSDTYYYLLQAAYWSGANEEAAKWAVTFARKAPRRFADMIRGDDQTTAVLRGMAKQRFDAGALAESRDLNQVLAFALDSADEWNNYAFLCRESAAYEESLRAYERALELEPDSPQLLNDAGVILHYHLPTPENQQRARGFYERAAKLAEEQLGAGGLSADAAERTRTALRDARSNLVKLRSRR
jgi:tetratricopeptide (TPR) repeat protein